VGGWMGYVVSLSFYYFLKEYPSTYVIIAIIRVGEMAQGGNGRSMQEELYVVSQDILMLMNDILELQQSPV